MQGKKRDWSGVKQGKLTVIEEVGKNAHGAHLWKCACECGAECVKNTNILNGGVKSCSVSCGIAESNRNRARHGAYRTKEYGTWAHIKQRCFNPDSTHYHRYGGRGITMHPAWVDSFEQFLAEVGKAPEGLSLDRIDNEGNYEPGNMRWATRKEQSNNREVTLKSEIDGEELTLVQIADRYGINYTSIFHRYKKGLRGKELVTKQKIGRPKHVTSNR